MLTRFPALHKSNKRGTKFLAGVYTIDILTSVDNNMTRQKRSALNGYLGK